MYYLYNKLFSLFQSVSCTQENWGNTDNKTVVKLNLDFLKFTVAPIYKQFLKILGKYCVKSRCYLVIRIADL